MEPLFRKDLSMALHPIRSAVILLATFVLVAFGVFVINQTAQVVQLAGTVHPRLGVVTLWSLLVLYGGLLLIPLGLMARLPRPLHPPMSEDDAGYPPYLDAVRARLRANRHLAGIGITDRSDIDAAIAILDQRANRIICDTASTVFVSTAVSQSGRLDGLMVLIAQSRMVWGIANTYYQRPSVRDLWTLYSNVAATAFAATSLDDIDLSEQIEPVVSAVAGSAVAAIPGLQVVSTVFTQSVTTGAANAFLTLRVGTISKRYCNTLLAQDRRVLRRSATAEAATLLAGVTAAGTIQLSRAFGTVIKSKLGNAVDSLGDSARAASAAVRMKMSGTAGSLSQSLSNAGASVTQATSTMANRFRATPLGGTGSDVPPTTD